MTNSLMIAAYPEGDTVYTSLRFANGYTMPDVYAGDAEVTQVTSKVNATHYSLVFRCRARSANGSAEAGPSGDCARAS